MFKKMAEKLTPSSALYVMQPNPIHEADEVQAAKIVAAVRLLEAEMTAGYRCGLQTSFQGFVLNEEMGTFRINGLIVNKRITIG